MQTGPIAQTPDRGRLTTELEFPAVRSERRLITQCVRMSR